MGDYASGNGWITIDQDKQPLALAALRDTHNAPWSGMQELADAPDLIQALCEIMSSENEPSWDVAMKMTTDPTGETRWVADDPSELCLSFYGKFGYGEQTACEVIAPFVTSGHLDWSMGDDDHWRWTFVDGRLSACDGRIVYPNETGNIEQRIHAAAFAAVAYAEGALQAEGVTEPTYQQILVHMARYLTTASDVEHVACIETLGTADGKARYHWRGACSCDWKGEWRDEPVTAQKESLDHVAAKVAEHG